MQKQNIPIGWEIADLGSIASLVNGYAFKSHDYVDNGVLNFRVTNIKENGRIDVNENVEFLPLSFMEDYQNYLLSVDDILVVMVGATRGKLAIIPAEILPALMNQNMWKINVQDILKVNQRFLFYFLSLVVPVFINRFSESTRGFFKKEDFRSIKVNLPPLDEQRRIAHVLTTVQTAIEQQAKLIDLTRELKSALMGKLFTEGLHGEKQKETEIGLVPAGWNASNIGEVARFQSGGTPSREKPEYWSGGTIPWVKTGEINYKVIETTEEFITEEGLNNSAAKLLPKGTLLCAMYGQGITRGRVGILGLDATTNQACAAITPFDENQVSTWFLYYYMQYHYQNLRELGHGANQRNLNMDLIKSFPLSYPASDEQKEIVKSLSVIDKKISRIEKKRTLLEELFRTLLHQLMTGEVRTAELRGLLDGADKKSG